MGYRVLADATVAFHFGFVLFVVAGGFLVRRHRWVAVPHLLAAAWGVYIEAMPGRVCPLTPLENEFSYRAGGAGYQGGFIEHYLMPVLYPDGLTRTVQWVLAAAVVLVNVAVYAWTWRGTRRREKG